MFFQQPSWLQYQQQLQNGLQENNLENLFHVSELPKASQCRNILDGIDSEYYRPIFKVLFEQLRQDKQLEKFRLPLVKQDLFYVAIDGSLYHSSKKISCDGCLIKKHSNGTVTYQHKVLQGTMMHPDRRQLIPLIPEPILQTDGQEKQDCEHNAAKRFLTQLRKDHPHLPLMIGGDGLFSNGPMIRHVRALNMHYLFTWKPGDHTHLMEWLETYEQWDWQEHRDEKDVVHRYRWRNQVPLSAQKDAPLVNFFEYHMLKQDVIVYQSSWITDVEISLSNIFRLIKTGHRRSKMNVLIRLKIKGTN